MWRLIAACNAFFKIQNQNWLYWQSMRAHKWNWQTLWYWTGQNRSWTLMGKHPKFECTRVSCFKMFIVHSCGVCCVFALDYCATSCNVSVLVVAHLVLSFIALSLSNMDLSTMRHLQSDTARFLKNTITVWKPQSVYQGSYFHSYSYCHPPFTLLCWLIFLSEAVLAQGRLSMKFLFWLVFRLLLDISTW